MPKGRVFDILFLLQIALGVFFIVSGILSILDYDSIANTVKRAFGNSEIMELIVAVIMLCCGLALFVSLFFPVRSSTVHIAILIVFILWIITIVFNDFLGVNFDEMNFFNKSTDLGVKNSFIALFSWIKDLALDSVVLGAIWAIRRRGSF